MIVTAYVYNDLGFPVSGLSVSIKENPNMFAQTDVNGVFKMNIELGQTILLKNPLTGQVFSRLFYTKQDSLKIIFPAEVLQTQDLPIENQSQLVCEKPTVNWVLAGFAIFGAIELLLRRSDVKKVTI